MVVNFYTTNDPFNMVTKNIIMVKGFNNLPNKENIDILKPQFDMLYDNAFLQNINYMRIEDFGRYYFTKTEILTGGRVRVMGEVDVLMTANQEIRNSGACLVLRSANNRAPYLTDKDQAVSVQKTITVKQFPYEFKNFSIMLLAAGGN